MKKLLFVYLLTFCSATYAQTSKLTKTLPDGTLALSEQGVSYFANLSLSCASRVYPHFYNRETLESAADLKAPDKMWPSFYGCFDWHSGVHNHWALVKLLKNYPKLKEAKAIRERLEQSFAPANIAAELAYFKSHQREYFEYPYGTGWLLKVATELKNWNDTTAQRWHNNLLPLTNFMIVQFMQIVPYTERATMTGDHYATSLGLSFLYDYSKETKIDSVQLLAKAAGEYFYKKLAKYPLANEPVDYDFMSGGLLIADFMGRILPQADYDKWIKTFAPDLFTAEGIEKALEIKKMEKHDEFESHFDGFHLNRIWCINSIIKYASPKVVTPEIKKIWMQKQKEMWDYAQESIGKGNYDIDHWLSSFSVYAMEGNK